MSINIPDAILNELYIIRTDLNNKIIYASNGISTLTGYSNNELIGATPALFRDHTSLRNPIKSLWYSLDTIGEWKGILRNKKKDGSLYYQNSNIKKEYDSFGNHIGYFAINTDISESIKNPSQFIFESNFFNLFFSSDTDIMAVCLCISDDNPEPKLLEVSNKLLDMLGTTKSFIINNNMSFVDLLSNDSPYLNNQKQLIIDYESGKEIIIGFNNFTNKSKKYMCKLQINKFEYQGHSARVFKLTDITNEIENSKKLEEINKAKNNFLANFSHEIRTPLNATIGFMELIKDNTNNHTMLEYLNIVLDNSKHLLEMMNDVIDFTSIDNNNFDIIPRDFSPKDIQSTIEIFYAKSLEKEIDFTVFISPQLPERMTQDILRIKQIISNLLSNSLKFTDYGGKIVVDVYYQNEKLFISIEDNGIGMTDSQISKIFDPFQQASSETELRYGGNGLGLSVVKKIIEKMDGEIFVESKPDMGTKFKIILPIIKTVDKNLASKLDIKHIYLYLPNFSKDKIQILKRYIQHFTEAKIIDSRKLPTIVGKNDIIILFKDDVDIQTIETLTISNKIILIKKFNDIISSNEFNELNIQEITLPLLGSKLYDAFYSLIHNKLLIENYNNKSKSDLKISGHILIAEDMKTNILLMENILKKFPDLKYKIVENGIDTVTEYINSLNNNKKFDMILLDENMPGMSGSVVAAKIRDYEKQRNLERIPLISITANRYNKKSDKCLIDMDEYLTKPVDIKELFTILLKYTNPNHTIQTNDSNQEISIGLLMKNLRDAFISKNKQSYYSILNNLENSISIDNFNALNNIFLNYDKNEFQNQYNIILKNIRKSNK